MKYNIVSYLIGEGLKNVSKNKKSTITSITTMCITMLMFGAFFIIGQNANYIVKNIEQQQGMQVFIEKTTTEEEIKEMEHKIREINGVNTVTYITKEESLNKAREQLKEHESIEKFINGMDVNYFPSSFTVTLTDLSLNNHVQSEIRNLGNVEDIVATDKTISTLESIANGLKIGILVILIALMIMSVFIISNTIKLSVHARRKEISIMKYVGATNSFIKWPFMVEGIIIGIISALTSIIIVGLVYSQIAINAVQIELFQRLNIKLVSFGDMFELIMIIYLIIGAGIGILGSTRSMKKYLEV